MGDYIVLDGKDGSAVIRQLSPYYYTVLDASTVFHSELCVSPCVCVISADVPNHIRGRVGLAYNNSLYFVSGVFDNGSYAARVDVLSSGGDTIHEGTPLPHPYAGMQGGITPDDRMIVGAHPCSLSMHCVQVCGGLNNSRWATADCLTSAGGAWSTAAALPQPR